MTTSTLTLTDFLLARIAEDEATANEAGGDCWEAADRRKVRWVRNSGHGWVAIADLSASTTHIVRWDPARALAECKAKRRIVALHTEIEPGVHECPGWFSSWSVAEGDPCPTLRLLALPYADHPDYREEWKP